MFVKMLCSNTTVSHAWLTLCQQVVTQPPNGHDSQQMLSMRRALANVWLSFCIWFLGAAVPRGTGVAWQKLGRQHFWSVLAGLQSPHASQTLIHCLCAAGRPFSDWAGHSVACTVPWSASCHELRALLYAEHEIALACRMQFRDAAAIERAA